MSEEMWMTCARNPRWAAETIQRLEGELAAARAQLAEAQASVCHHGWRGSVPERGEHIVTPCPACGAKSLFIGSGGHLTCACVPSDHGDGCTSPSVEETVKVLKAKLAEAEADAEKLAVELDGAREEIAEADKRIERAEARLAQINSARVGLSAEELELISKQDAIFSRDLIAKLANQALAALAKGKEEGK